MSFVERLTSETNIALHCDPASRAAVSRDFGGEVTGASFAVAIPRDTDELVKLVRLANADNAKLTIRGKGYSQSGQSVANGNVTVETRCFDRIQAVTDLTVTCGAAVTWRQLLQTTLRHGLVPRTLPLNLDMTIGGLLSAGGLGANSHREGAAVNHVVAAEIVTGAGEHVEAKQGDELLTHVLGGLGRCGIITRVTLRLRPTRPRIRTFAVQHTELEPWLREIATLSSDADYLEGFCWATPERGWRYEIRAGVESSDATHLPILDFHQRYEPRFAQMVTSGAWQHKHPWIEALLPEQVAPGLIESALAITPTEAQDGHRVMLVKKASARTALQMPAGERSICFAILPTSFASDASQLDAVSRKLTDGGGKRYLSGWLGTMTPDRWSGHYGDFYDQWLAAKRRYDPNSVLTSALFA